MDNVLKHFDKTDVLVFDLDGTLLQSDMLYESFWSGFSRNSLMPILALRRLSKGRSKLKAFLAENSYSDIVSLPYNEEYIALAKAWRAKGGKVVLATATTDKIAKAIAAHLGIFDAVHSSDATTNLKGASKADLLVKLYGKNNFIYVGDSKADLPVWKEAACAVTTNISSTLRDDVEKTAPAAEHVGTHRFLTSAHLKALRPHQWLKNILVFLPTLLAHQIELISFFAAFMAFVAFSFVASAVYVLNDLLDLAADRAHPRKRKRPFAAGTVPISHGTTMAVGLFGLGFLMALFISPAFLLVMLIYLVLTTAYSLRLKRVAILDICMLAGLYSIRIVAGGVATGTVLSVWLLAFAMFFFLSLAAVKRQAELVDSIKRNSAGASGRDYYAEDLPVVVNIAISSGLISVLILVLYINSDAVRLLYQTTDILWAICVVLVYWIMRTVLKAHRGEMHDDPVVFAAKDQVSLICFAIIAATIVLGALV